MSTFNELYLAMLGFFFTICDRDMQAGHMCFNPVVVSSRSPKTFCLVILNSLFR